MATLTKSLLPISGYTDQYYTYRCVVTENSYSVANNTSNVTITFSIKGPWAPSFYEWETNYGIVIDGTVKKTGSSSPYIGTSYVQLLTWTGDIAHNADGSKSINVGVYLYHSGPSNYLPKQYTSSAPLSMGSVTLTTIPRASSLSLSTTSINVGSSITANISSASSSFTHTVEFYINDSYYQKYTGVATSQAYTIPTSWYAAMPSSTSCTAYCRITTYNGSTQIGSQVTKSFTVNVPSGIVPTVGAITLTPQTYDHLIQGKNKLKISVSGCSAGTGSSIKSYTFSGPGISSTTTSTSVTSSGTISNTGTLTYTVKVTDNRGRTASKTATIVCYAWATPSISLDAYRVSSSTSTTEDDNGTYVRCTYSLSYSSVNSTNDVTVKIYYKQNSASSWSSTTVLTDSTSTSGSKILSSIDTASTYTVYATITDNYGGSAASTQIAIFGASRILNITSDGTGVAFGKMAENTKLLESKYKIKSPGIMSRRGTRPIDANTSYETDDEKDYLGTMEHYLSSNQMTSNKPTSGNGHIIHCHWDNATTAGDSQLFLHASTGEIQSRGCTNGTWNNWRTILDSSNYTSYTSPKPEVLYNNSSGTTGTVTLSKSAANYSYIEIFLYKDETSGWWSVKAPSPNGKTVQIGTQYFTNSSPVGLQLIGKTATINGTTITPGTEYYMNFNNSTGALVNIGSQESVKIMRVDGYK